MTDITDIPFIGAGPFATPLLARFVSLDYASDPRLAILRCEFEDGATVHVPVSSQAADAMLLALQTWQTMRAQKEADEGTKH